MTGEVWLAVGTIIAAIAGLAGIMWSTRPRPEPLSTVVQELQDEMNRREGAYAAAAAAQNKRIQDLESQVNELQSRLATVTRLEKDKSVLMAGIALLSNQLIASRITPIWELPEDLAPKKPGTGPLGGKGGG